MQALQKSLSEDCLADIYAKSQNFIPFFKERDGMNKIISTANTEESQQKNREAGTAYPKPITPKLRLLTKVPLI